MLKPARFRPRKLPRRLRQRKSGGGLKWFAILFALLAVWLAIEDKMRPPEPVDTVSLTFRLCGTPGPGPCVIDGDTLAIGQRRIRLTGYDAPEMDGPCDNERHKAAMARDRLNTWLRQGPFEWTGGFAPPYDRYGRELREARRGEELLAEVMIGAGLAEGDGWGAERVEWC